MNDRHEGSRLETSPVGPLGLLDILVITILIGVLLSAVISQLPALERRAGPAAAITAGVSG